MIHSLFIINKQGEIIIEKHWRGRVSRSVGEKFWEEVKKQAKPEDTPPIISTAKYYLVHVYKGDLFYVGVVQTETPPLMITELLHTIVQTFEKYIGKVTDHSIKQNFVTVYQLLDEMIDNGFPITTELSLLQDLVRPPVSLVQSVTGSLEKPSQGHGRSPVPWRKLGIKYNNNEVFFDVVEELNCIIDVNGMVAFAEVTGKINVNCKLSGMPDLMMTFKDPTLIDDCTFHPCVRYARFDQDRTVSFVPPDGEFVLLTYRISGISAIPVYCRPQLNFYEGGAQVSIMAGLKQQQKPVEDVRVLIPLSNAPESDNLNVSVGNVGYDAKTKMMKWDIGKLAPQSKATPSVNGKLNFAGRALVTSPSSVHVQFKMPNNAISEIKVDSVQLKNEKYKPFKGVRYQALSGRFEVRTC